MLFTFIQDYSVYIILGLAALSLILTIVLIVNSISITKLSKKYRKFMRGSKDKNIEELIFDLLKKVDSAIEKTEKVNFLIGEVNNRLDKCVQKVSIIRYKAFDDMGSAALSFSIAFLDAHDTGIILTGIYGRDECTTYAKPIEKGVPKYDLSQEEKHALQEAMKKTAGVK